MISELLLCSDEISKIIRTGRRATPELRGSVGAELVVRGLRFAFLRHGADWWQFGGDRRTKRGQRHVRLLGRHRHFDVHGAVDGGEHVGVAAAGPEPVDVSNQNGRRVGTRFQIGRPIDATAQDDRWVAPGDCALGLDGPRGEWAELERQPGDDLSTARLDRAVRGRRGGRCRYRRQSSRGAAGR